MFGRKREEEKYLNNMQAPVTSMTLPLYRVIRVRLIMLITMFILGVITQFLMAIYTPEAWNVLYMFLKDITGK